MDRVKIYALCLFFGLLVLSTACAADDYWDHWYWECSVYSGTTGGSVLRYGVYSGSNDGYEETDHLLRDDWLSMHAGVYHQEGIDSWSGPTGFYEYDFRSPIDLIPGTSKSWLVNVWADHDLDASMSTMDLKVLISPAGPPPRDYRFTLQLLAKPSGVSGGPDINTSYDMSYVSLNWNQVIQLPVFRTYDGRNGYLFALTATAVPEPSGWLVLTAGLGYLAAVIRRRR